MGGGGGKSGGDQSIGTGGAKAANKLAAIAEQINSEVAPVRKEYTAQLLEALKTGGVEAQIPIMQRAVERTNKATSDTLAQTKASLAQSGLANSPFGMRMYGETALQGRLASSGVQGDIINQLLQATPNYALGSSQAAIQGLTGAGTIQNAEQANLVAQNANMVAAQSAYWNFLQNMAPQNSRASVCCWIFLAAHGYPMHPVVRRYRDEHMTATNRRGYYRLADWIVPRMVRSDGWFKAVRVFMTQPMTFYGKWVYGESRWGWLAAPIAHGWLTFYRLLGWKRPYRRSNGEVL